MIHWKTLAGTALLLALSVPASMMAQETTPPNPAPASKGTAAQASQSNSQDSSQGSKTVASSSKPAKGFKQQVCWQKLGIPESTIQQHKSIEEKAHSQIQSVCNDSSLSAQQKQQKIRDIRKSAHEQMSALLSPQQAQQLKECQREHGGPHGAAHGSGAAHSNSPCTGIEPEERN